MVHCLNFHDHTAPSATRESSLRPAPRKRGTEPGSSYPSSPPPASAGYLTVSEIFPIDIRAEAIAVFFAVGGPVEVFLGIDAEGKPLEQVARPLTAIGAKGGTL